MQLVKTPSALTLFVMSLFISIGFSFAPLAAFAATSEINVSGNTSAGENQLGWMFNRDTTTATSFAFATATASLGDGSLFVLPIDNLAADGVAVDNKDKFVGELFLLTPIANLTSISYDFKIAAPSADVEEHFYMNVYANFGSSSPTKFYDCRYNVIPTVGSTGAFTTVTFDPTQSYPVATRTGGEASPFTCPNIPADMDTLSEGSSIRVIAINVGDTSAGDAGVSGYLDNVKVISNGDTTVYDLEPVNNAPVANDQTVLVKKNTPWVIVLGASDIDGDSISLEDFTQPTHGELEFIGSDLVYTPDEDYLGEDEFTFTVTDGELVSNEGTVSIVVYVDTPSCAEENMVFIGGGLDKCMNLDSIFARVFAVSPAVFPNLEIFVDAFEGFNLPQFLSFLDTIIPDFSSDIDGVFLDPVCVVGSIFNANFDVCVDDGSSGEEETPTDVCPNIDGDQSEVPSGKVIQDGQCVDQTTGGGGSTPAPTSGGGGSRGGGGGGGGPAIPQVLGAATGSCYQFTRNLSFGMRGDDVLELQKILTAKGYLTVPANSYFGVNTTAAVKAYQAANGFEQVGMAGPKTRALLNVCPGGVNPNQALIDELTKKLNVILAQIQQLLAARTP